MTWAVSALCLLSSLKGLDYKKPETVRKILFSGEVMPEGQLKRWMEALPDTEFINLYGPSEITCNCTYYRIPGQRQQEGKLPIGHPFPAERCFCWMRRGKKSGKREQWEKSALRENHCQRAIIIIRKRRINDFLFIRQRTVKKKRCYRTGDMGCYGEEGELYFGGRKDFQIKHMGHRIELEEIERRLEKNTGTCKELLCFR